MHGNLYQRGWGIGTAVLIAAVALVLLLLGRLPAGVSGGILVIVLGGAGGLAVMRRMTAHPQGRLHLLGAPATRSGRWSLWLAAGFTSCLAVFLFAVAAGQRGGDTFFDNLWLTVPVVIAGACAVAAGAMAAFAIVARRERSVLVMATLVLGLLVTVFTVGEAVSPH